MNFQYQCAKLFKADVVLRLPADNPCPEPSEYDRLIDYHIKSDNDFSSNICNFMKNGYPDGIGVEALSFSSLETIWNNESYISARTTWTKNARRTKTVICNICKNDTHNPNLLRVGDTFSLTLNRSQTKNP